jgi:hypothetical protein
MAPRYMKVFVNKEDIDFDNVNRISPVQEWELVNSKEEALYFTRAAKFNHLYLLVIYFSGNYGGDRTRVYYMKLTGDFKEHRQRSLFKNIVYESTPNPVDHQRTTLFDLSSKTVQ